MDKYVIGLDYGSDSARAVLVNAMNGKTLATAVRYYPRWKEGKYCNPAINQYRQHPKDYIEVLRLRYARCWVLYRRRWPRMS